MLGGSMRLAINKEGSIFGADEPSDTGYTKDPEVTFEAEKNGSYVFRSFSDMMKFARAIKISEGYGQPYEFQKEADLAWEQAYVNMNKNGASLKEVVQTAFWSGDDTRKRKSLY